MTHILGRASATVALSVLALAGCATSGKEASTVSQATRASAPQPGDSGFVGPLPAASTPAPLVVGTSGPFPAVIKPTDTATKPVIAAGTGAVPATTQVKDLVPGTGQAVTAASTVTVKYVGANFADGKTFDTSWGKQPGDAAQFQASMVIPGFAAGLTGLKVGGRREIVIPPAQGYGNQAQGPIVANETLVFVVDLVSVS